MIPGDPACYRGTDVLINLYDIRDPELLHAVEYKFALARELELEVNPIKGNFGFDALKAIHHHVFQDTYEWAGDLRKIDFAKRSKVTGLVSRFTPLTEMGAKIEEFDQFIEKNNQLRGLNKQEFVMLFARVQARLNEIHPFREGNGRSTRIFMAQLARNAGFELDISKIDGDKWNLASHRAMVQHDPKIPGKTFPPSFSMMEEVLNVATQPLIDHSFKHQSKDETLKMHPSTRQYFDRLDSISEKVMSLGGSAKDGPGALISSAKDHIAKKLKDERVDAHYTEAVSRLAAIRPEVIQSSAEIYGPIGDTKIIESVMRDVFIKKGYNEEDVEATLHKTTVNIEKIVAMRAAMLSHIGEGEARRDLYERSRG